MKRLMQGDKVIGDYPDDWTPPEGCDMDEGIKDGSMVFVDSPPEEPPPAVLSLVEQILANPAELEALRAALKAIP